MRLLWFGDLDATGFGTVTADMGNALLDLGLDVRFVSQNAVGELAPPFDERTLGETTFDYELGRVVDVLDYIPDLLRGTLRPWPRHDAGCPGDLPDCICEPVLEGRLLANGQPWGDWKPDACVILGDYYGVRDMVGQAGLETFRLVPTFHYVPVEGHGLPPRWNELWDVLRPIAMSRFGQVEIEKVTGTRPPLAYHGVHADLFRPVTSTEPLLARNGDKTFRMASKQACKMLFGIPPATTLILRADRNMPRKGYPAMLRALGPVLAERPDVWMVLHCRPRDMGGDVLDMLSKLPVEVQNRIRVTNWGSLPRETLVALYNAADLYVSVSAEGFGLTIAEALACGVPAVGLDYSAVPEVVGPAGVLVPVGRMLDNEYAHHWALPDEDELARRVAYLLDKPHKRQALGALGPAHIRRNFAWASAAEVIAGAVAAALVPQTAAEPERELAEVAA